MSCSGMALAIESSVSQLQMKQLTGLQLLDQEVEEPVAAALKALLQLHRFVLCGTESDLYIADPASASAVLAHESLTRVEVEGGLTCSQQWAGKEVHGIVELQVTDIPEEEACRHFMHYPAMPRLEVFKARLDEPGRCMHCPGLLQLLQSCSANIKKLSLSGGHLLATARQPA